MKIVHYITYIIGFMYLFIEFARRGIGYFSINATTMVEDLVCGVLLLTAAILWTKKSKMAPIFMVAAWGYAVGGMFVPFFAHLEAWLRGVTFRADHPFDDVNSVILKGVVWGICFICFVVVLQYQNKELKNKG